MDERTGKLRDLTLDCEKIEQQQSIIAVRTFTQFAFATKIEISKIRNNNRQEFAKIS